MTGNYTGSPKRYILLAVGSPSDLKEFEKTYPALGNLTVHEYLAKKGILHPKVPIVVSCHRTLKRVMSYALEAELFADTEGRRMVCVFFGGLSLALPGIFSSETSTLPIIGVPAWAKVHGGGIDAATAVYNLPPGTVVAGAPLHSGLHPGLDRAVLCAELILDMESPEVVFSPSSGDMKYNKKAQEELAGITYSTATDTGDTAEISLSIVDDSIELLGIDRSCVLALQCRAPTREDAELDSSSFTDTLETLEDTRNTLYFGNPANAVSFLKRILALSDRNLRQALIEDRKIQKESVIEKYGPKVKIDDVFS
ncbi:MAG: AIR carboxylase family protein [Candidatus Woesearchaeota archaeon]